MPTSSRAPTSCSTSPPTFHPDKENSMAMDLGALGREMTFWRRDLHAHPEFGFEEKRTSAFVAARLREFGLDEVVEGVGGTGVVGSLKRGAGNRAIALRADMDAL